MADLSDIARPTQQGDGQMNLLGGEWEREPWEQHWWGMPEFSMENASPQRRLTVNFLTKQDVTAFEQLLGIQLTPASDSIWFPDQGRMKAKEYIWRGIPSDTRYPVYIPSKGRAACETTGKLLQQAGVDFRFVVEETEFDLYEARYPGQVLRLPFHDLGQGSIPARNWIWEHAQASGDRWHWILDDNILGFWRTHGNRRLVVKESSAPLRAVEDFADRYDNLAFAGLSADGFCPDRNQIAPFTLNTRIYSVTLINTAIPLRWRGRYNEDTDICLRALKAGWSTALLRAFLMKKAHTARSSGKGGMPGGNTDHVYNTDDHRLAFAQSLKDQHPDCVEVVWKFGRWHHQVDYSRFSGNKLILKDGVVPTREVNEYGLKLVRTDEDTEV